MIYSEETNLNIGDIFMKASVQYNDLKGTAAADISDFYQNSLQNYLVKSYEQYDGDRYNCCGCTIFVSGQHEHSQGNIEFICKDTVEDKYVKFCPMRKISLDEIFSLFKRFEVVIGEHIDNIDVDDNDYFDLI